MVLNARNRQKDAILRMLNFNEQRRDADSNAAPYKLLILDDFSKAIIAPLIGTQELRQKGGITLHLSISSPRDPIPDVPAVYFVRPTAENVGLILKDAEEMLYDCMHLNFTSHIDQELLRQLAEGGVKRSCVQQIAKIYDQYLAFIALESNMFSLGLPNTYLELNNPTARDHEIEASTSSIVEGLFSALASMACVPIIRCPKGGAAEHIGAHLDQRIREHLKKRNSLFHEGSAALASSMNRPLLCLFDRSFELSVILQHSWTYKPLVHDVFNMDLNRVTLDQDIRNGQGSQKKSYEVGEGDPFWEAHGRAKFQDAAGEIDVQLKQFRKAKDEINEKTGLNVDDPQLNTGGLSQAVQQLPELLARKTIIEKHSDILTALMRVIRDRQLDLFHNLEENVLQGKADLTAVISLLQGSQRPSRNEMDNLRLALVYLLTTQSLPSDPEFARLEAAIGSQDASHLAALRYVRRMRRLNLTGKTAQAAVASEFPGIAANSQLLSWAGNTFGQGFSSLTKGVKNMLAGEQQAAVTVAVEGLMDAKPVPELESFAFFDPRAAHGRTAAPSGVTHKEAVVFIVGGGNYLEAESLMTWASKAAPPKHIVYGATELLTAENFTKQLAALGQMSM